MEQIERIKQQISESGSNYIALSAVPALKIHVYFSGKLADKEVMWDATIQTLASYHTEELKNVPAKERSAFIHSFMQIEPPEAGLCKIHIVLGVPIIDEPTIKKTIIMIRCYKRLKVGYHEFGKNL